MKNRKKRQSKINRASEGCRATSSSPMKMKSVLQKGNTKEKGQKKIFEDTNTIVKINFFKTKIRAHKSTKKNNVTHKNIQLIQKKEENVEIGNKKISRKQIA